ncbi:hypothetical protein ACWEVD_07520 [Nocardia thailandica]|uniref:hypothetical protein n=1 Tax=Nocardia thailandica TaxID=257275 RepID=UPI00030BCF1A|nr:hypothetical protein [Nocardia thailandica]
MRVMVVPVLATTALACTVIAAGQARPASLPVVYDCADVAVTQPASLTPTCADLGEHLSGLTWTRWDEEAAEATGTEHRKTCVPDCATGPVAQRPVTVRLSGPHGSPAVFTRLRVTDAAGDTADFLLPVGPG